MKARLVLLTAVCLAACAQSPAESSEPDLAVLDAVEIDDHPQTPEALFAEFAPLPGGAVAVDYAVTGPGGMAGTMHVVVAEGARRAQSWSLQMPIPGQDAPVEIAGASIQTPTMSWTDAAEGSAERVPLPLGRVAEAFFERPPSERRAIIEHIRAWHEEVARGREAHPGTLDAVLGQRCLRTMTAGQSLCVWEQTGLPLEYRSESFSMVAKRIRRDVPLEPETFRIPADAPLKADALQTFDVEASLKKLADGDLAELPGLLQPRLRVAG